MVLSLQPETTKVTSIIAIRRLRVIIPRMDQFA